MICSNSACPTLPIPAINKLICLVSASKKDSYKQFRAFFTSFCEITAVIFLSEAPWAIARILTLFRPKVLNILPLIPWWFFILSPITAIIDKFVSNIIGSIFKSEISFSNSLSIAIFAIFASLSNTPMHIECSDDAWVVIMIFIFSLAKVSKSLFEKPGIPTMPFPWSVSNVTSFILLIPLIGLLFTLSTLLVIRVPFSFGNKVFFIKIGMFLFSTGSTVGGYNTFAPKCDNSIASK